jgi:hypothetical protein
MLSLLVLAGGCAHVGDGGPAAAPEWCGGAQAGAPVTVRVTVDLKAPTPIAVAPTDCRVRPGTRIRWLATGPDRNSFERITFKIRGKSAASTGAQSVRARGRDDGREAVIDARWVDVEDSFPYAVHAGGKELDPDIIIDPARYRQ